MQNAKLDLSKGKVEVFATNLQTPSHIEWTKDGKLLVSETSAGRVSDVTKGGKIPEDNTIFEGLKGPSSIAPLEDGRIYVCETFAHKVTNIGISNNEKLNFKKFNRPYSIVIKEGNLEVVVRESNFWNRVVKIDMETGEEIAKITHILALPLPD